MELPPEFLREFEGPAKTLLKANPNLEPQFSKGTYQLEFKEGKKSFFPFLQMDETGKVYDFLCTCPISEKGKGCPHLVASLLRIYNGQKLPLHVRFQRSLWNQLCRMQAERLGFSSDGFKKTKEGYVVFSKTKKPLFQLVAKKEGKKKLDRLLKERPEETEETSLKFFHLTPEELALYREGKPSFELKYELSFWSDLAKWLFYGQDNEKSYEISFTGSPLPQEIQVEFSELKVWSYIPEVCLASLIPSLAEVRSPLKVMDQKEGAIESVRYNETNQTLEIRHSSQPTLPTETGIEVGEWMFVEKKGFFRKQSTPLLQQGMIEKERIASTLSQWGQVLKDYLPLDFVPKPCRYHLFFDKAGSLHVQLYLFEIGDLESPLVACFIPWIYVPKKGFFLLEEWEFEGKEKVIPASEMPDWISRHRIWLHQFPGFQTHLGSLESHLVYRLEGQGDLVFDAELNFPQEYEEALHFDEWIYIKSQGFYMKKESRGRLPLHPGLVVPRKEISSFIATHREELEQIQGFFNPHPILKEIGISLFLNEEEKIVVEPKWEFQSQVDPKTVEILDHVLYCPGQGFSEIPPLSRLPLRYQEKVTIPSSQESAFLTYEMESLKSYIRSIDPRIQKPQELRLKVHKITPARPEPSSEWWVEMDYESEIGKLDLFSLWEAMQEKKKHFFSTAGLLFVRDLRFHWLSGVSRKKFDRQKRGILLNTLEWIRLTIFEKLEASLGEDPESVSTRKWMEELSRLETHRLLDTSRLKAQLRPYQEQGLHWLWFLYCYGLSGLLCDDMGLGKTHQAMALIASIAHEDREKKNKYLVVCPTSVIYHWQELLARFLPETRVCIYHGLSRSQEDLADFESRYDVLVTSYGILRTGREDLRPLFFELAIFDEIQIAKNAASQTHQALRALRASMRLGLSGTPIENHVRELKSLMDLVLPGYLPQDALFRELFITPIEKGDDPEKKNLLSRLIKPFILRRKKSEVLRDLPEKIEEIAYCDLSEEQKKLYSEVAKQYESVYSDLKDPSKPTPYVHIFSILSRLKQVCDHPCLIHGNPRDFAAYSSGKFDLFLELLEEAMGSGQKVVVFSQFLDMIAILEAAIRKKGIGYASIKGSTRDRSEQLRRFREDPQCCVFVASLLAAGVGIDLTVASIVIHYDRWWNPAKENQATDRVHRIGQSRGVQVFKLVTKNTIEEHIHAMIERKKGLLEDIIGEEDQINILSREELLVVFEKLFKRG